MRFNWIAQKCDRRNYFEDVYITIPLSYVTVHSIATSFNDRWTITDKAERDKHIKFGWQEVQDHTALTL